MTGTSRVCITATTIPAKASTGTITPVGLREGRSAVVCVIAWGLQAGWEEGVRGWSTRMATWMLNPVYLGNYSDVLGT
ncbi:hypothetical protein GCM10010344_16130 [Streptomyces bluensis]|nr:hypothetical protein GCM10010344_16130 [Streptomyces bluensis]